MVPYPSTSRYCREMEGPHERTEIEKNTLSLDASGYLPPRQGAYEAGVRCRMTFAASGIW
jgi:hypothetical protein